MKSYLASAALLLASPAMAANYAYCILERSPGVANNTAAYAVYQACQAEHPGGMEAVPPGSGRGKMFGFKSSAECTAKKAADTRSEVAAQHINGACRRLYDDPPKLIPFNGKLD